MAASKNKPAAAATDEIVITRVFDAPRELVFEAWTNPGHLAHWWGPVGFTNPVCNWDVRAGGKIDHVMRGPDGTDYPMGGEIFEVTPPARLVLNTGARDPQGALMFEFRHVVTFDAQDGKTLLTIRSRLTRASAGSDKYTSGYRAGMTQSLERLAGLVEGTTDREVISTRVFARPREAVYAAFRNPARLGQWWGPNGFTNTMREFDLRPGGAWHITMHGPGGADYLNESRFLQVEPPGLIVFEHLGPVHWYRMTMTFAEAGGGTKLTWHMVFASAEECTKVRKFILAGNEQNFDRLAAHLAAAGAAVP